ncbi:MULTISPECIES: hypothetical protein [Gordonia]|uniref:hypothetical protein n=1 Tax=Gordonia TaxID=2053 RepID=UPI00257BAF0C|nr:MULTISPECIES: hypothetical protein [Gordonia]
MSTLTMQDIAVLARVSRPAVSQWRKRPVVRGQLIPFPTPVATVDTVEHFDEADIMAWLERTGRGKNLEEQHLDVGAYSLPDGVRYDDVVLLLALYALSGVDLAGASHADLVAAAVAADPTDESIAGEVRSLDVDADTLTFTDHLINASLGTPDALARLERGRLGRARSVRDLTDEAMRLMRHVVEVAVTHVGDDVAIVPVGGSDLALAVADTGGRLVVDGGVGDPRDLRRRAIIAQVETDTAARGPAVSVVSLLGAELGVVLEAVDAALLELNDGDVVVILASAAALTDHLAGDLQRRRSETLKIGNTVAALRLPRGMWREAHRQSQAMWICKGGVGVGRLQVADLNAIDPTALGDLASDIAAALDQDVRRAFRFTRPRDMLRIRTSGTVVPQGTQAPRLHPRRAASHADRVHEATLQTSEPAPTVDILISSSAGRFRTQQFSIDELIEQKLVTVMSGNRIDPDAADPEGTVAVLPDRPFRLDPFDAAQRYPRARRTEPGDIVLVEKPAPRAVIDTAGGSLVAAPAKILRIHRKALFGPHTIAAIINTRCAPGSEWRTWCVPEFTADEAARLETALTEVADYQRAVEQKAAAAKDLVGALIDGIAEGEISLDADKTTAGITATAITASTETA